MLYIYFLTIIKRIHQCRLRGVGEIRLAGHGRKMAVESRVTQEEIKKEPEKPMDRENTCPWLLLRVSTTHNGRHHPMDEFSRGNVPSSELQIYTWMDATLKELTSLVKGRQNQCLEK
uniref:18 kDa Sin3-associated polypeptide n=1 Tax=Microcebus murinus TaxID=30608 RepID=A0A8C5YHB5_MICMU